MFALLRKLFGGNRRRPREIADIIAPINKIRADLENLATVQVELATEADELAREKAKEAADRQANAKQARLLADTYSNLTLPLAA